MFYTRYCSTVVFIAPPDSTVGVIKVRLIKTVLAKTSVSIVPRDVLHKRTAAAIPVMCVPLGGSPMRLDSNSVWSAVEANSKTQKNRYSQGCMKCFYHCFSDVAMLVPVVLP